MLIWWGWAIAAVSVGLLLVILVGFIRDSRHRDSKSDRKKSN